MKTYTDPMSIRDSFAAAALQGLLANNGDELERFYYLHEDKDIAFRLAAFAYVIADAMLLVRDHGKGHQP